MLSWASVEEAFLSTWGELPDTRNRGLQPSAALQEVGPQLGSGASTYYNKFSGSYP